MCNFTAQLRFAAGQTQDGEIGSGSQRLRQYFRMIASLYGRTAAISTLMQVTLEIPEQVARSLGYAAATLPRRALEALLVDECARGNISRGKVAEILELSFQQAEGLFKNCRVPYPMKNGLDDAKENSSQNASSLS